MNVLISYLPNSFFSRLSGAQHISAQSVGKHEKILGFVSRAFIKSIINYDYSDHNEFNFGVLPNKLQLHIYEYTNIYFEIVYMNVRIYICAHNKLKAKNIYYL